MEGTFVELFIGVNWLAVIVGAIVAYALGALWYSQKFFGAAWMRGSGAPGVHKHPMALAMLAQAGATFLFALIIGITETTNNILFAILIILTASGLIKANGLFADKSYTAIAIETGFVIAMGVVFILTHAVI